jgi:hypothetical protein
MIDDEFIWPLDTDYMARLRELEDEALKRIGGDENE